MFRGFLAAMSTCISRDAKVLLSDIFLQMSRLRVRQISLHPSVCKFRLVCKILVLKFLSLIIALYSSLTNSSTQCGHAEKKTLGTSGQELYLQLIISLNNHHVEGDLTLSLAQADLPSSLLILVQGHENESTGENRNHDISKWFP